MSLSLTQSATAVAPGLTAWFLGIGGTEPYTYAVVPGGAGGTVVASGATAGMYTAPAVMNAKRLYDTIRVTDSDGVTAVAQVLIANPLFLFCEIIQRELGLANGRVYLWEQNVMQPTDDGLYIAVSVPSCKPFGNTNKPDGSGSGLNAVQVVNMLATLDLDIMSRGPDARDRKEEVLLALASNYAESQQGANSFYIGKLPPSARFVNLSNIDGASIPYRFRISVNMQYAFTKTKAVPYFDTFEDVQVNTNP